MNKQTTVALSKVELANALASHVRLLNNKIARLRFDAQHAPTSLKQQADDLLVATMEEERRYQAIIDWLM